MNHGTLPAPATTHDISIQDFAMIGLMCGHENGLLPVVAGAHFPFRIGLISDVAL